MPKEPKHTKRAIQEELQDHLDSIQRIRYGLDHHERWLHAYAELLYDLNPKDAGANPALLVRAYRDVADADKRAEHAYAECRQMRATLKAWAIEYGKELPDHAWQPEPEESESE